LGIGSIPNLNPFTRSEDNLNYYSDRRRPARMSGENEVLQGQNVSREAARQIAMAQKQT
jgi:hypothetical protein